MATINQIVGFVSVKNHGEYIIDGNTEINGADQALPGTDACIGFLMPNSKLAPEKVLSETKNSLMLVGIGVSQLFSGSSSVSFIEVEDPRTTYIQVLNEFFTPERNKGIHPTATVETDEIGNDVFIGSGAYIGPEVEIGNNVTIHSNVVILGKVSIGNNSIIGPNTVIGFTGFGYGREEDGSPIPFPHFGGVRIGNHVEIGGNTSIDRGTLQDTVIEDHAKIDNLVHVAHNCKVESGAFVIASTVLCGGVIVGKNSWIAPNSSILEKVTIGENATVGLSSTVIRDVVANDVVVGSPAKSIRKT
jgi:UDP-3-O-[3-hydroxymyristoyl] glucosamine N-acyltransferase